MRRSRSALEGTNTLMTVIKATRSNRMHDARSASQMGHATPWGVIITSVRAGPDDERFDGTQACVPQREREYHELHLPNVVAHNQKVVERYR